MSRAVAIEAEGLGKRYELGRRRGASGGSLREALTEGAREALRAFRGTLSPKRDRRGPSAIWALKDVDLTVQRGEVLGIIGHNGAGKSTLLKILSRITTPTAGRARIHGRVGSLLEVGTGFHRELTGRENIYLNGAILGMTRSEIAAKFDEIVDFAGVEEFVDTPIKRYSSGMGLRLGFAVAAHIEPEVLLVDEVLAVGDLEFQRKCLGQMQRVTREGGRTILFVSHNLYAIQSISDRVAWFHQGRLHRLGDPGKVIAAYRRAADDDDGTHREAEDLDSAEVQIDSVLVNGVATRYLHLDHRQDLRLELSFTVRKSVDISLGASLHGPGGVYLSGLSTMLEGRTYQLEPGHHRAGVVFPGLALAAGAFTVNLTIMSGTGNHFYARRVPAITIASEILPTFDGLLEVQHDWIEPRLEASTRPPR
ncbi:MAG: ABC transporter ATP-binding protein [Acidobacteria bacterium]|nr:MAG: ABC transporter ATP-binding protein [Acidobacteriota bacterium]REK04368.1 MAG: ABC transporter ATP-binding protein [Acidobacteriota bacterium]